jgi:hypothetical protein
VLSCGSWTPAYDCGRWSLDVWKGWVWPWLLVVVARPNVKPPVVAVEWCVQLS